MTAGEIALVISLAALTIFSFKWVFPTLDKLEDDKGRAGNDSDAQFERRDRTDHR